MGPAHCGIAQQAPSTLEEIKTYNRSPLKKEEHYRDDSTGKGLASCKSPEAAHIKQEEVAPICNPSTPMVSQEVETENPQSLQGS